MAWAMAHPSCMKSSIRRNVYFKSLSEKWPTSSLLDNKFSTREKRGFEGGGVD